MPKPHLRVSTLSFSYPESEQAAIQNISFQLQKGSFSSLISRSGEGKSTLFKLIAGLLQPDAGEIFLGKERIKGPDEVLIAGHEKVALVDQHLVLPQKVSVYDLLHYAMRAFPRDHREARTNLLLNLAGLEGRSKAKPEQLSGGQRQKLTLLFALASEPDLLLLDEPFSHLDAASAREVEQFAFPIIKKWKTTTLMVSHLPEHALAFSDELIVLQKGKLLEQGSPEQLYFSATNLETAMLLGFAQEWTGKQLMKLFPDLKIEPRRRFYLRPIQWKTSSIPQNDYVETKVISQIFCGDYWRTEVRLGSAILQLQLSHKAENNIWVGVPDVVLQSVMQE